jgi:NAD(P)-dependent dehydrogenase (short-subunit alcohol dehydrogenase family)
MPVVCEKLFINPKGKFCGLLTWCIVMAVKNYTTSVDGIESQFATNHIGHFLLTNLLMDKIFAAGNGARIVNVASFGYLAGGVRFDDWNFKVSRFSLLTQIY